MWDLAPVRYRRRHKQAEGIDVVAAPGPAHAEVEVRTRGRPASADARGADPLSGLDGVTRCDGRSRKVEVRRVEAPVGGAHGDGQAGGADRADEAHLTAGRGDDRRADGRGDVDPPVLPRGEGIRGDVERLDDLARDRPSPAPASTCGVHRRARERGGESQ
jgi:hypothetical protein